MTKVVIIGGGIAGLASAALLARSGYDVDLFELHHHLGGRAGELEIDGFRFDTGPSWLLMREVFEHFFALLGTTLDEQLPMRRLDPAYRVYFEGHDAPIEISASAAANCETFERVEPGAGAALARYLQSAETTYDLALNRFLYTWFGSPAGMADPALVRRLPALSLLLGQSLQGRIHRRFDDHRLRQILGFPAVFLGTSPDRAPSMYHLMSSLDLTGGVYYPDGGMHSLIRAIARCATGAGARLHTGTPVQHIRMDGNQVTGVQVTTTDGPRDVPAHLVVGAGDIRHIEGLLPAGQGRPARYWRRRDPGPGGVLAMLGVAGRVPELDHHTLFFTRDWEANFGSIFGSRRSVPDPASIYVCAPSRTDPSCAPEGMENLFMLIPVPAEPRIGAGGADGAGSPVVERAVDAAIGQVSRWAGIDDLAGRVVVRRTVGPADFARDFGAWSGSLLGPAHTLRQSAFARTPNASRSVRGLYYAGAGTVPGVGLPMCLISAEVLLKRLTGDTSGTPLPAPLPAALSGQR